MGTGYSKPASNYTTDIDESKNYIQHQPNPIVEHIASYLPLSALGAFSQTCKRHYEITTGFRLVKSIAAGFDHTICLLEGGQVLAWGLNKYCQLGLGDKKNRNTPTQIQSPLLTGVKSIAAGGVHTICLLEGGQVLAWGRNDEGQLGLGDANDRKTPTQIPGLTGVKSIATGGRHTICLLEDGQVLAWGYNGGGQLGLGDTNGRNTPTQIPGLTGVKSIAAGGFHTICLLEGGQVLAWGYNTSGQLGLGDTKNRNTPALVFNPNLVFKPKLEGKYYSFKQATFDEKGGFDNEFYSL